MFKRKKEVDILSSSFKTPVDTAKAILATADIKNSSKMSVTILLSFLAGVYIAFGGLLAIVATSGMADANVPIGLEKFIFGAMFPLGLMLVVIAGSELFTGNIMFMAMGALEKKVSIFGLSKNWILSWIFNFVGALFVAYVLTFVAGVTPTDMGSLNYAISQKAIAVAQSKVSLTFEEAFIKGIGCNWLVCLAVWLANASDDVVGKIFGIWFPVMAFVTIGFEHCIANMFFIPLGIFLGAKGVTLNLMFLNNLIPVTLGNIVGGAIFVACIYWYTYLKN